MNLRSLAVYFELFNLYYGIAQSSRSNKSLSAGAFRLGLNSIYWVGPTQDDEPRLLGRPDPDVELTLLGQTDSE